MASFFSIHLPTLCLPRTPFFSFLFLLTYLSFRAQFKGHVYRAFPHPLSCASRVLCVPLSACHGVVRNRLLAVCWTGEPLQGEALCSALEILHARGLDRMFSGAVYPGGEDRCLNSRECTQCCCERARNAADTVGALDLVRTLQRSIFLRRWCVFKLKSECCVAVIWWKQGRLPGGEKCLNGVTLGKLLSPSVLGVLSFTVRIVTTSQRCWVHKDCPQDIVSTLILLKGSTVTSSGLVSRSKFI